MGFVGLDLWDLTYSGLQSVGVWQFKLLQPPTGSVIEHVRILFSKLEMRFNAGTNAPGTCLFPVCRQICRTKPQRLPLAGASQTLDVFNVSS